MDGSVNNAMIKELLTALGVEKEPAEGLDTQESEGTEEEVAAQETL